MSDFSVKCKVFWLLDNSGKKHLRFVISDPNVDNKVLIVNATDIKNTIARNDSSCFIYPGEHPRITKISVIFYSMAEERNASSILSDIKDGKIKECENLSEELLSRIQNGAKRSKFLHKKFKKFFEFF
jgi:hypothetical protein